MSPGHRERVSRRRFGAGLWWVELVRLVVAVSCLAIYGVAMYGAYLVLVAWR